MNRVSLLFIKVSLRKNLANALEGISVLDSHKNLQSVAAICCTALSLCAAQQHRRRAAKRHCDTQRSRAEDKLVYGYRVGTFPRWDPSRGGVYLSKRSSASSVGLVLPFSGLAWHAASCSVRRRLISARISLGKDKRARQCCGGGHGTCPRSSQEGFDRRLKVEEYSASASAAAPGG